ncbi:alkaline phosphatase D family protein [Ulvibacterium marinum]|nr:alkaline phosphatase D family protein [Ulvibacterium marinum]
MTALFILSIGVAQERTAENITHGPILGHVTDSTIRIWIRTGFPGKFTVTYSKSESHLNIVDKVFGFTYRSDDNAGWVTLKNLYPDTHYNYEVGYNRNGDRLGGTFKTLPSIKDHIDPEYNPKGLFNFRFEFGSCASQNSDNSIGPSLPAYTTMLRELKDNIDFAIMNGDWLYEENRDQPASVWLAQQEISKSRQPDIVTHAPTITGVWENYRIYMSRGTNLMDWHRSIPSYFTFDDHELVNDIWGAGTAGRRDRRTVFRDIGTAAWYDYLGWANPIDFGQKVHFGSARFKKNSNVLYDSKSDFDQLNMDEIANLHVHWGTPTAGVDDIKLDSLNDGNPNSMVYDILGKIDKHRLKISPNAPANGKGAYSIGRKSYSKFTVANCDFFLLDTRTNREWHDTSQRDKPGLTMLGREQYTWLTTEMDKSEADFFFVVSSVPFMIPHIGAGGYAMANNKDESWTVFLDEREKLISFWEELDRPVFVLTGDLHNSFAIKITDQIYEFCSGPHNSLNHQLLDEGNRPKSGPFKFDKREMDILWSSFLLNDIPRSERKYPHYCVVQINNVFNSPKKVGSQRWVAYEYPQVIFQYFDGRNGELRYSETISTRRLKE